MECDNKGCRYTAYWEVTSADGKKKSICPACYETEGWDKRGPGMAVPIVEEKVDMAMATTVPAEFEEMYSLTATGRRNWRYSTEAADQLWLALDKYGSWALVANALGIRSGELHRYRKALKEWKSIPDHIL